MAESLGAAQLDLTVDQSGLNKGLGSAEKTTSSKMSSIGKTIGKASAVAGAALAAVGAAAVSGAFKVAEFGDDVAKSAGKAGQGVEQFQELKFAFKQGGVEAGTFDTAMQKFNKRLGESATTGGTADEAFESLGISLKDADGNVREAGDAMDEVLPKLAEIESDSERAAIAGDMFGQRAGPELSAALSDGMGSIDEARQKAQDLGIVMGEEAAGKAEDFTDAWDDIKSSVMGTMRNALTPLMTKMADDIFPYILDTAIPALQRFGSFVSDLWDAFDEGDNVIDGIMNVFEKLKAQISEGDFFGSLLDSLKGIFDSIVNWLTSGGIEQLLGSLMEARMRMIDAGMRLFESLLDAAVKFLPKLLTFIADTLIPRIVEFLTTAIPRMLDTAVSLFETLVDALTTVLPELISTLIGDVLPKLLNAILKMLPEVLQAAVKVFTALVDAVVKILPVLVETLLGDLLPTLIQTLVDMLPDIMEAAIKVFTALVDAVIEILPLLVKTIVVDVVPKLVKTLTDPKNTKKIAEASITLFTELVDAIIAIIPKILSEIADYLIPDLKKKIRGIPGKLKSSLIETWNDFQDHWENIIEGLRKFVADKGEAIITFFRELPGNVKDAIVDTWDTLKNHWDNIIDSLRSYVATKVRTVIAYFKGIPSNLKNAIVNNWNTFKNHWENVVENLRKFVVNKGKAILDYFKDLPENIANNLSKLGSTIKIKILGGIERLKTFFAETVSDIIGFFASIPEKVAETLRGLGDKIAGLVGIDLNLSANAETGDGPGARVPNVGGKALNRVQEALKDFPNARITNTYRSPAKNRAVGGSPTSYHLDKDNPAVDIGGPPGMLNQLFAVFQQMGGWRELLGPPNDPTAHGDHVHVAHMGGTVSRNWPTLPGLASDERPAIMQIGEKITPANSSDSEGETKTEQNITFVSSGDMMDDAMRARLALMR